MSKFFELFPETQAAQPVKGIPGVALNAILAGNAPAGEVGIELEIEGSGLPATIGSVGSCPKTGARWTAKNDGSLRNGIEYVVSKPCSAASVEEMVDGLFGLIAKNGGTMTLSNRCSTHVHLNISDFKINQITSLMAVWAAIEPTLVEYCGIERKTNHFCLSILDSTSTVDAWDGFLESGSYSLFTEGLKYAAFNIRPLWDFGSAEIRCGRAPHSAKQVGDWARLLWAMRNYAARIEDPSTFPALLRELKPSGVLREICSEAGLPDLYLELVDNFPLADTRGFKSFAEVRGMCYKYPWTEWLPSINAVYIVNPFSPLAPQGFRVSGRTATASPSNARMVFRNIEELERASRTR